jgi:hypothetical protein
MGLLCRDEARLNLPGWLTLQEKKTTGVGL